MLNYGIICVCVCMLIRVLRQIYNIYIYSMRLLVNILTLAQPLYTCTQIDRQSHKKKQIDKQIDIFKHIAFVFILKRLPYNLNYPNKQ